MKKIILTLVSIFMVTALFSQERVKNLVVISDSKNLTAGENAYLPDSVRDKLESNFQTYTSYEMISSNEASIKKLQRKSETAGFDEETAIEVGKLTSASHAIFLVVVKVGKNYSVTAEFANLTTGKSIAKKMVSGISRAEELFSTAGCAVDEITIDLCDQLGIPLSNTQKFMLKYGNASYSDKEKLEMFNQEITNYNKQIATINKEIAALSKNTDLSATAKKAKLESERALMEEKRKVAEANKVRLAEIEKAKAEDLIANNERSEEQKKKILNVAKEVNDKAAKLRKMKMDNQTALGMQRVIELKKATLIDIRENVKKEQRTIEKLYIKEYDLKIEDVNKKPWRKAELSGGQPIESAIRERELKVADLRIERDVKIREEQNRIENATEQSQKEIFNEILTDLEDLEEKTFYANTLNGNLFVSIDEFDGNKKSWDMKYSVLCDGVELYFGEGEIKYSDLERIRPSGMSLLDAVDMYDRLFKCNEPVLTFDIAYKVKSIKHEISTYEYEFGALKVFDTTKIETTKDLALSGANFVCAYNMDTYGKIKRIKQMSPGYDIRTEQDMQVVRENERKACEERERGKKREEAIREKARKREELAREKVERKEMREDIATAIEENKIFYFNAGGAFSANYHTSYFEVRNNYDICDSISRGVWLLGGSGDLGVGGTRKSFGCGCRIYIGFFKDLSSQFELNFLPIVAQFYFEKHFTSFLSSSGFVMRPQFSLGIGGGGVWGNKVTLNGISYVFTPPAGFILMGTAGFYFDFYLSRNIAIYFGPTMNISALFSFASNSLNTEKLFEIKGFFNPSLAIGMRFFIIGSKARKGGSNGRDYSWIRQLF